MSLKLWIPIVLACSALALRAEDAANLTPRDKTEVFIQHLVKVAKLDPTRSRALVLEYEIGTALTELAHADDEDDGHGHAAETEHSDGDACCARSAAAAVSGGNFIRSALRELYPDYAQALDLAAGGKLAEARELARALSLKSDPYLAANASLALAELEHEIAAGARDRDGWSRVIEVCERIAVRDRLFLIDDHRACELIAQAFAGLGKPLQESLQYWILLTDYNDLPKDVDARVKERLQALSDETGKPMGTVARWMNGVEKLLGEEKTGKDPTQAQEIEIVSALDKLIELQEARERKSCKSCGSGQCRGSCKNGRPRGSRSQNPAMVSALSTGKGEVNLHGVSRGDAGTIWGQLKERDASRALQGFRGKLPVRYERLLEQYYKSLSRGE